MWNGHFCGHGEGDSQGFQGALVELGDQLPWSSGKCTLAASGMWEMNSSCPGEVGNAPLWARLLQKHQRRTSGTNPCVVIPLWTNYRWRGAPVLIDSSWSQGTDPLPFFLSLQKFRTSFPQISPNFPEFPQICQAAESSTRSLCSLCLAPSIPAPVTRALRHEQELRCRKGTAQPSLQMPGNAALWRIWGAGTRLL